MKYAGRNDIICSDDCRCGAAEGVYHIGCCKPMVSAAPCRGRLLGDPSGEAALASPGGVAERSESFKIMIAGGNHSKIKKLLSEARLMRGGDRLVNECSWMSGICFNFHHSTYWCGDFKLSPPLISHDKISVPKCRYFIVTASPRGKPRGC